MKKLLILIILLIPVVYAGVSHPSQLNLNPNEEGNFHFAIDAALFNTPIKCNIEFQSKTPLEINFNKKIATIEAGERIFIDGTVKVPKNTQPASYKETFCVSCEKLTQTTGTTTKPRYCNIPVTVNVKTTQKTPVEVTSNKTWIILIAIINILLITTIIFLIKKLRNPL